MAGAARRTRRRDIGTGGKRLVRQHGLKVSRLYSKLVPFAMPRGSQRPYRSLGRILLALLSFASFALEAMEPDWGAVSGTTQADKRHKRGRWSGAHRPPAHGLGVIEEPGFSSDPEVSEAARAETALAGRGDSGSAALVLAGHFLTASVDPWEARGPPASH